MNDIALIFGHMILGALANACIIGMFLVMVYIMTHILDILELAIEIVGGLIDRLFRKNEN